MNRAYTMKPSDEVKKIAKDYFFGLEELEMEAKADNPRGYTDEEIRTLEKINKQNRMFARLFEVFCRPTK